MHSKIFVIPWEQVCTEEQLAEAISTATGAHKDSLCFIEVLVHKDDTSKELLEWGSRVCSANSRPPNPQQHFGVSEVEDWMTCYFSILNFDPMQSPTIIDLYCWDVFSDYEGKMIIRR